MIVHTLKMCKGDAGPEQSLVLLYHVFEMMLFSNLSLKGLRSSKTIILTVNKPYVFKYYTITHFFVKLTCRRLDISMH